MELRTIPKDDVFLVYSMFIHGGSKARPNLRNGESNKPKHNPLRKYKFDVARDISIHRYISYPKTTSQTSGWNFPYVAATNEQSPDQPQEGQKVSGGNILQKILM